MGAAGGRSGTTGMGALQFVDQLVDRRSCIVQCGHREITDRVGDHDAAYSTAASSASESRTGLPRMLVERGALLGDLGLLHRQQATAARGSTSSAATVRAADPPRP